MNSPLKIGQLAKELVAIELRKESDPCAAAAQLVKETLIVALKAPAAAPNARTKIIADVCQGAMTALILKDHDLPRGAVLILETVAELSSQFNLDPTETMTAALTGLADVKRFVSVVALIEIQRNIDRHFMGAGEAFVRLATKIKDPDPAPQRAEGPSR